MPRQSSTKYSLKTSSFSIRALLLLPPEPPAPGGVWRSTTTWMPYFSAIGSTTWSRWSSLPWSHGPYEPARYASRVPDSYLGPPVIWYRRRFAPQSRSVAKSASVMAREGDITPCSGSATRMRGGYETT